MRKVVESDIPKLKALIERELDVGGYELIERLGGMTNHTYRVRLEDKGEYVIRIPGEGTEKMISRRNERINTMLACELGIDARMLFFGEDGTKVTEYVKNAETLNMAAMKNSDVIVGVAGILKKLHACGKETGVPFDVFDMAKTYEKVIKDNAVSMYSDYEMVKARIMKLKKELDQRAPVKLVPCHNDPLCENWLKCGNRLYLIDWEYAGMNDGMWDLADVSVEADYHAQQDELLLNAYLGHEPSALERQRFVANKLYLDYLWTLWGKARVPYEGEEMERYALGRYMRLKANMQQIQN